MLLWILFLGWAEIIKNQGGQFPQIDINEVTDLVSRFWTTLGHFDFSRTRAVKLTK